MKMAIVGVGSAVTAAMRGMRTAGQRRRDPAIVHQIMGAISVDLGTKQQVRTAQVTCNLRASEGEAGVHGYRRVKMVLLVRSYDPHDP